MNGSLRVLRGGSWINDAWNCRAAGRYGFEPAYRYNHIGFRVCFRLD
jgi:formylglycine-generating enzyme required for sulfatase activity